MRWRWNNLVCGEAGLMLAMAAFAAASIPEVHERYHRLHLVAFACCAGSLPCFAVPVVRGPLGWRLVAGAPLLLAVIALANWHGWARFAFNVGH